MNNEHVPCTTKSADVLPPRHPATFHPSIMDAAVMSLKEMGKWGFVGTVLDPFAGIGGISEIKEYGYIGDVIGIEIEPEWANQNEHVRVGDATKMDLPSESVDVIITSPTYGNRMADHHNAKDGSKRNTYKHTLGRDLNPRNTGAMHWGEEYRNMHREAWRESRRVLRTYGVFILNVKDHIRRGVKQEVSMWHVGVLTTLGFRMVRQRKIFLNGNGFGANNKVRVPYEYLFTFIKTNELQED